MKKLLVAFPGMGYHTDKPLLYYPKKAAMSLDYDIVEVSYTNLPSNVRGNLKKMYEAFEMALAQTETQLSNVEFTKYDRIVFVSKSIGTAVAAAYAERYNIKAVHAYMTPVEPSFEYIKAGSGILFHGLSDPWCDNDICKNKCGELGLEYYEFEDANHSIETGDVKVDLANISRIMDRVIKLLEDGE